MWYKHMIWEKKELVVYTSCVTHASLATYPEIGILAVVVSGTPSIFFEILSQYKMIPV